MTFEEFETLAAEQGLQARSLNDGTHWQLRGGYGIVNFYPTARDGTGTIHRDGSKRAHGNPQQAIDIALPGTDRTAGRKEKTVPSTSGEIIKLRAQVQAAEKRAAMWQHAYRGAVDELDELKK